MPLLHLHVVGTKDDGSACPLGKHIPGSLVRWVGAVGICPQDGQARTGSNGVAEIDFTGFCSGVFALEITVTTPGGKVGRMVQSGYWANPFQDVTWVLGVPGACEEGDAGADAKAWWDGLGDVGKFALVGAVVLGGYLVVRAASSPSGRETIRRAGAVAKRTGTRVVRAVRSRI